ncbi:hypothetical protein ABIB51_000440 [Arthrobacter sp. UYCu712]
MVQRFVGAGTAGVLFTANPVTGTRTETVIDASPGPGLAVVSGAVNPDHFVLDTATAWVLLRAPGGPEPGRKPSLSNAQLSRLTSSGDAVQSLFGCPQDVEWLIDASGKLWLTQSRPITTLYPLEDPLSSDPTAMASEADGTRVYLCGTLLQGLTRPITPLGLSVLGGMRNGKGTWKYFNPGLRMYVDLTPALRSRFGRRYLLRFLPLVDGRSASVIPVLLADPRFRVIRRSRKFPSKPKPADKNPADKAAGRGPGTTAGLRRMLALLRALLRAAFRPEAELRRAKAFGKRLEAELALPSPATALQRLDYAERSMDRMVDGLIQATLPAPVVGYIMLAGA